MCDLWWPTPCSHKCYLSGPCRRSLCGDSTRSEAHWRNGHTHRSRRIRHSDSCFVPVLFAAAQQLRNFLFLFEEKRVNGMADSWRPVCYICSSRACRSRHIAVHMQSGWFALFGAAVASAHRVVVTPCGFRYGSEYIWYLDQFDAGSGGYSDC